MLLFIGGMLFVLLIGWILKSVGQPKVELGTTADQLLDSAKVLEKVLTDGDVQIDARVEELGKGIGNTDHLVAAKKERETRKLVSRQLLVEVGELLSQIKFLRPGDDRVLLGVQADKLHHRVTAEVILKAGAMRWLDREIAKSKATQAGSPGFSAIGGSKLAESDNDAKIAHLEKEINKTSDDIAALDGLMRGLEKKVLSEAKLREKLLEGPAPFFWKVKIVYDY